MLSGDALEALLAARVPDRRKLKSGMVVMSGVAAAG